MIFSLYVTNTKQRKSENEEKSFIGSANVNFVRIRENNFKKIIVIFSLMLLSSVLAFVNKS